MKKIHIVLIALLTIGLVSAGLVSYLSNTAEANIQVDSPMSIQFAKIGAVDSNGGFNTIEDWADILNLDGTTGLSTSELGVKIVNNADITISDKTLELKVTTNNPITDVSCNDISSLQFWDTATPTQIAKGYQELSSLCSDKGNYVVYNIDINSLSSETTYKYPVKLVFGNVESARYNFEATLLNEVVV